MAEIWLVRHGKAGDLMGDYDRLSDLGWQQARHTGAAWTHLAPVDVVLSGTMRRHQETAQGFTETFGELAAPELDARWNEFGHKEVIEKAFAAGIEPPSERSRAGFSDFFHRAMGRWADPAYAHDYAEPHAIFQARVDAAVADLAARLGKGERAVVFTSGGVISAVCRTALGLTPAKAFELNTVISNASVSRLLVGRGKVSLAALNIDTHFLTAPELHSMS